jgi:putative oxygen-independent coproporphyrinogen III oxidase
LTADWQNGGFGLYLHWPYCLAKCPYCDFNSHVSASVDQSRWQRAFLTELDRAAGETGERVLNTVFFGGGTPSLMDPELVNAILTRIRQNWRISNSFEVSLEANPTSVESGRFRAYRDAGVNRLSMGIQALNDHDLRRLGRMHSAKEACAAFDIARGIFDRVSFDLIYARQDQTLSDWSKELSKALSMAVNHLSLYQLTLESGTAFYARHKAGGLAGLPSDTLSSDLYTLTQDLCDKAGKPAYEVSNHAAPGAESRHNLIYWRYGDYLGIGPGAHGRLTLSGQRWSTVTPCLPKTWLENVENTGKGYRYDEALCPEDQATEMLMMGLRINQGVSLDRYAALAKKPIDATTIEHLEQIGMLNQKNGYIFTTRRGRMVLNSVLAELI